MEVSRKPERRWWQVWKRQGPTVPDSESKMFGLFTKPCKECGKGASRRELGEGGGRCSVCAVFEHLRTTPFLTPDNLKLEAKALANNPRISSARICKELQKGWSGSAREQSPEFRRILLAALEEIGDPEAAGVVAEVGRRDYTVLSEVTQVLHAMKLRHPTASLPPPPEPPIRRAKVARLTGRHLSTRVFREISMKWPTPADGMTIQT